MGVMSVAYTTINGQIVSEKRNGVPSDYIPDALGSTIALLSDTHQITDTWTYWPNGQVRTRTGTNPTPFTFGGTRGYHSDMVNNFTYVRARQLRTGLARWQTLDHSWPHELPFNYCLSNPASVADPTGDVAVAIGLIFAIPGVGEAALTVCGVVAVAVVVGTAGSMAIDYFAKKSRMTRSMPLFGSPRRVPMPPPLPPPLRDCASGCNTFCYEWDLARDSDLDTRNILMNTGEFTECADACTAACEGWAVTFTWQGSTINFVLSGIVPFVP
jgi:hypothetical protein